MGVMLNTQGEPRDGLRLFCNNCADEEYVAFKTAIGDTGYGGLTTGDRRRYGIGLRYMF